MIVLWIANTIFPDAARHIGEPVPVFGGWMYGLARDLAQSELRLAVATVYGGNDFLSFSINGIQYFLIPRGKDGNGEVGSWKRMVAVLRPDLVHIHGTEYSYGMTLMEACPSLKYVVSIQGLVSVYYRYYLAGMTVRDVLSSITLRDILRRDTIFQAKEKFFKRGLTEVEYIQKVDAVIGRTDWDFDHVNTIRPGVPYYFCNESLRDEFYCGSKWSLDECDRYSIFLSQGSYPLKGLHQVIKAAAILKSEFSTIKIRIAGPDIVASTTLSQRLRRSGYGIYIKKLIEKYGLEKHVEFLGPLDAVSMKKAYLDAHVFICPSSIENSPNSLGEAQILGVPSIASYVGGVPFMLKSKASALVYRFEEHEMLASHIRCVFYGKSLSRSMSDAAILEAVSRHNRDENRKSVMAAYEKISGAYQ